MARMLMPFRFMAGTTFCRQTLWGITSRFVLGRSETHATDARNDSS